MKNTLSILASAGASRGTRSVLVAILSLASAAGAARGADYLWDGTTNDWNTAHWLPGPVAGPTGGGDRVTIDAGTVSFPANDVFGNWAITASPKIVLNGGVLKSANNFNTLWNLQLGGGTLLCNGGAGRSAPAFQLAGTLTVLNTNGATIPSLIDVAPAGNNGWNAVNLGGQGDAVFTLNVADVTGDSAPDLIINAVLQDSGPMGALPLVKTGAGTLLLNAENTYGGETRIEEGTIQVGASAALPANTTLRIAAGASLRVSEANIVVGRLFTNGVPVAAGTYTAAMLPGFVEGNGSVIVSLYYSFDNGAGAADWQGWEAVSQNAANPKILAAACSERGYQKNAPCLTTRSGTACGDFQGDGGAPLLVARSPSFRITGSPIAFVSAGGNFGALAPNLGNGAYDSQVMGVALVRASDGVRVASARVGTQDEAPTMRYNTINTTAYVNDGHAYYLEAVDTYNGGWGYVEWDSFAIPGALYVEQAPQMQVRVGGQVMPPGTTNLVGVALPGMSRVIECGLTNLPAAPAALQLTGEPRVVLSGAPEFTLTSDVPAGQTNLAPGAGTSFTITFTPRTVGSFTGLVSIANNDPGKNPYTFTIIARSGPLAYYTFDHAGNPWEDSSGNIRHITGDDGTAPAWSATGGFDGSGAYSFNNARLIAPINADVDALPRMTWGAWVKTAVLTGQHKILGTDDGCGDRTIGLDDRGDGWAGVGGFRYTSFTGCGGPVNNPVAGFAPGNTTDWTFIAATYDQATATTTLYVDLDASTVGDPLAVFTKTPSAFDGTGHNRIGIGSITPSGQGEAWAGAIDQVFVFDDVLDLEAITALRDARTAMPASVAPGRITLLTQPQPLVLPVGGSGAFSLLVTGAPPFGYQWYHGTMPVAGATDATLTFANVSPEDAGQYRVVITNSSSVVTSAVVALTVYSVSNHLLAHWTLDETTGLAAHDATPNHFDGVLQNFPGDDSQWQFGLVGTGAIGLSGARRVEMLSSPALNLDSFTVSFWLQLNSPVPDLVNLLARERLSGCPSWGVELGSGNVLNFFVFGASGAADVKSSVPLEVGPAYHIACRYSHTNTLLDVFVNGVLVSTNRSFSGLNGAPAYDEGGLMFGGARRGGCGGANSFEGLLDDVQLYNQPLTVAEVGFLASNPGLVLDPVLLPPTIVQQPRSQEVSVGDAVSFTVVAEGTPPLLYQWIKDGTPLGTPNTNGTLSLVNVQETDAGSYSVMVFNFLNSQVSDVATLTVVTNVQLTAQPQNLVLPVGGSGAFSVGVKGAPPLSFQWYHGRTAIAGATAATLVVSNAGAAQGGDYWVVVSNGLSSATSAVATLTFALDVLLAYEGFDYQTGTGSLAGKNGGFGWGEAWVAINGEGQDIVGGNLGGAVGAPAGFDARSQGNHVLLPNMRRDGRMFDVSPTGPFGVNGYLDANGNIGADGKTLYVSFLQQPNGTGLFYEFEFHRDHLGDPGRVGGVGNDLAGDNVNLRTGGSQTPIGPGNTAVNFYVVRIDFKPGADDVRVYMNPTTSVEPETATLTRLAAADLSFDGIAFGAFLNNRTVRHDEVRLGTTWASVLGLTSGPLTASPPALLANGHFQVGFAGVPNNPYTVYFATNVSGPWLWLTNLTAGPNGLFQLEDPTEPRPSIRFYRTQNR